jgi:hypothetical protein
VALAGREPTGTDSAVKGDTAGSDIRVITSGVGTAATSGVMRRSSGERGGDTDPTAGGQRVQCESLRLRRVRGVPLAGEAVGLPYSHTMPSLSRSFM